MIPAEQLNPHAIPILMEYLREDILRALSDRRPLEEKWLKYQRLYKCQPEFPVKEFPFYGASNLVLGVVATDVDTIYSRLGGIIFGPENIWSCRALREDAVEYAPRLQEFLKWAQGAELNAYPAIMDWLLELCKLGTGVLKERYRREQKLSYEFRETPQGTLERFTRLMTMDNPRIEHVSLYDFLVPAGTIDHQEAPWNAERILLSWEQLQMRQRMGIYAYTERLGAWHATDKGSWLQQEMQSMQHFKPSLANKFELWEVWTEFDVRGIGEPQPVVCTIHLPSMTYLRIDWNPFFHQEKPYDVGRYMRQEKQFYGIGISEMLEMYQEEGSAMHNQRIDSNTIGNAPMMKFRRGIGIKEDEPVFIGRWIGVDDMADIEPMKFGIPIRDTTGDENLTMQYASRRTGVNDYVMGNATAATGYAALGTNVMQHQEAAKRFDQTLRETRSALGSAGRRCVELYQQFNTGGKEFTVLGPEDGAMVNQVLRFPLELIRHSVAVEVTATSAALNKDTQIRTNTIIMQMTAQFYQQMLQMMQLVVNPMVPPPLQVLAMQAVVGSSVLMRRLLDSYDMQDVDRIIPDMQEILNGQQQQLGAMGISADPTWQLAQQGLAAGGAGGGGGPVPTSGMGLLPARVG